jgi:hypothetical protein
MPAPSLTFLKIGRALSACPASALPFSNMTEKSPRFQMSASTRMASLEKAKSCTDASLVHGTATSISRTPAETPPRKPEVVRRQQIGTHNCF